MLRYQAKPKAVYQVTKIWLNLPVLMAKNMSSYTCNKNFHGTRRTIFEDFLGLTVRLQNTKKTGFQKKNAAALKWPKPWAALAQIFFPFQFLEEPTRRFKKTLYF
jgi:hypothetical protein